MNSEAHKIVAELEAFDRTPKTGSVQSSTEAMSLIASRRAKLEVLVAEEQAKSAAKMERFNFWLIAMTIALFFIGLVQIAMMFSGR